MTNGESMTYSEMVSSIRKLSGSLCRKGLGVGDTVLLMASNHIQLALVYLAVWKSGGCCASLTLDLFPEDIKFKVKETNAQFIIIDEEQVERVSKAVDGIDIQVLLIGEAENYDSINQLLQEEQGTFNSLKIASNDFFHFLKCRISKCGY